MSTPPEPSADDMGSPTPPPTTRRTALIAGAAAAATVAAVGVAGASGLFRSRHHHARRPGTSPVTFVAALNPPEFAAPGQPETWAQALAFSPDGRTLAAGYEVGDVRLWDVATLRPVRTLKGSPGIVCLAFSPDGKTLACGSGGTGDNPPTHLWNLETGRRTDLPGSGWTAFSPDGRLLAISSGGDRIWLWSMLDHRKIATLGVPDGTDFAAFGPDGKTLACGGGESNLTMQLWDIAAGTREHQYVLPLRPENVLDDPRVVALSFDPRGRPLAIDDSGGVWDIAADMRVAALPAAGMRSVIDQPFGVAGLSPDGRTVVGGSGRNVGFYDMATGKALAQVRHGDGYQICGWQVAFNRDSSLTAVASGPEVLLYHLRRRG